MASGGYEVTFSDLMKAAVAYEDHGRDVKQALARFRSAADLPGSAFGNLAESGKMASGYEEFLGQTTQDITKLCESLVNGAVNLAGTAGRYWATEELIMRYLRYRQEVKQDNANLANGQ